MKTIEEKVLPFLSLKPFAGHAQSRENSVKISTRKRAGYLHLTNETKLLLDEFYRPYNEKLAELIQDQAFIWK